MTYIYCNIMTLKRVLLIFSYGRMVELHGAVNAKWNDFRWSREWKYRFEGTFTILKCDFREITIDLHTKINALHCPWSRDRVCCTLKYLCTLKSRPRESLESWMQVWSEYWDRPFRALRIFDGIDANCWIFDAPRIFTGMKPVVK